MEEPIFSPLEFGLDLSGTGLTVNPDILWLILSVVFLIFLIFSLILVYHWNKFGFHALAVGVAEAVYFAVSIFLILGAVGSILLF